MSTVSTHPTDGAVIGDGVPGVPDLPAEALAPSSPMAQAARRFGDDYPPIERQWVVRCAALAYVLATIIYLPWLFSTLDRHLPWLAWPFFAANVLTGTTTLLSAFNHWWRLVPEPRLLPQGAEPLVGVIIPCCGEPLPMILRTVASVLEQDWPHDRLLIVVSDDGHDPALEEALRAWPVLYH